MSVTVTAPSDGRAGFGQLHRVIDINEAGKSLLLRSFEINLRALDAIVQSKRNGALLRGFDEVSSQIRTWSRQLQGDVERLVQCGLEAVTGASLIIRERRMRRLMAAAAERGDDASARACSEDMQARLARHEAALSQRWRQIGGLVDDLKQLGMMACVLSRSALIEASSAGDDSREHLTLVSRDFYAKSEEVVETVGALARTMKEEMR